MSRAIRQVRTGLLEGGTLLVFALLAATSEGSAQPPPGSGNQSTPPRVEIYGRVVTDIIHDFNQNDPAWFDVMRPSQLPAFRDEFGEDGRQYFSVRQTLFGVKPSWPTALGEVRGHFEFDLFGEDGQTGFDLLFASAEMGKFGVGQMDSPFMDGDVFPNSLEYWGPVALVFYRNIQFRYMPIQGDSRVTLAVERPGATGDRGDFEERIELENVVGRFPWPDLSAEGRLGGEWGHVELSGILRAIQWDDLLPDDEVDLDGSALGWGLSLSSNLVTSQRGVLKLQATYGQAISTYTGAPFDIGIELNPGDPNRPILGVPLPFFGIVAFYDHSWSDALTTSLGYSRLDVENSDGQAASAFASGQYALINLLYSPTTNVEVGGELQWGGRDNAFDGFAVGDLRLQLSARFDWSLDLGDEGAVPEKLVHSTSRRSTSKSDGAQEGG